MPASSSGTASWFESLIRRLEALRADRPVLLSFTIFVLLSTIVTSAAWDYWFNNPDFLANITAEIHGTLMDLLLFGCLLLWLDQKADRHRRIRRYRDAIEDFLGWESAEATHRIIGNIRRLNREGVTPETLKNAYLPGATLEDANLAETSLDGANLTGADLMHTDLSGAYLGTADLSNANLQEANLQGVHFGGFLSKNEAGERHTTNLTGTNLRGANLKGVRNASAETFADALTLYKAQLDPQLEAAIEAKYPALIDLESSQGHE